MLRTVHPQSENRDDTTDECEVTIVMPCLNEARTVGRCVEKALGALKQLDICGEVIVADNGSVDGSPEIARSFGARVVFVEAKGYGNALRGGIAAARGTYIIMGDADDSYDFGHLEPFIDRLHAGDDLVMGNRFEGGIRPGSMPWLHRYIGNPFLTGILNLFFRTQVGDAHCGMRAFKRSSYERLLLSSPGMEFASEMVVRAALAGLAIREVPIVLHPDGRDRPPHLRSFRDGWRHLRYLLLMCPLWLYLLPALVLMGTGAALMVWLTSGMYGYSAIGSDMHAMLLGTLCIVLGYQAAWFWMFAKVHGSRNGLLPTDPLTARLSTALGLERGLLASGFLILSGLLCFLLLSWHWGMAGLSALEYLATMRHAFWGSTLMILGAQTAYGSFFLNLLSMPNNQQLSHDPRTCRQPR